MKRAKNNAANETSQQDHKSRLCLAALARLWRAEPESSFRREDLIELARTELGKYDLTPDELDEAAPMLAKSLHMRLEQNGGAALDDSLKQEIERQVLEWCGCIHSPSPEAAPHSH